MIKKTPRKVLVAIDQSENAKIVLRKARQFCDQWNAEITVLHVTPDVIAADHRSDYYMKSMPSFIDDINWLNATVRKVFDHDPNVKVEHWLGDPTDQILHRAHSNEYDLVMLGSHGRIGFHRVFLGSVAESVLNALTIDCMVIKADTTDNVFLPSEVRIVVPYDFSEACDYAVNRALNFIPGKCRVFAVNVKEFPAYVSGKRPEVELRLRREASEEFYAQQPEVSGGNLHFRTFFGDKIAEQVGQYTMDVNADMVIMPTRCKNWMEQLFWGSNAQGILREASCPTLILKDLAHLHNGCDGSSVTKSQSSEV